MNNKRLVRLNDDKMVFGVCSGIAYYFDIDPVIVRLLFVLLTVAGGNGIIIYLLMAILMPEASRPAATAKANGFDEEEIVIQ
jgi:phage shock protein C